MIILSFAIATPIYGHCGCETNSLKTLIQQNMKKYYSKSLDINAKKKYSLQEAGKILGIERNRLCKLLRLLKIFDDYNYPNTPFKDWFELDDTERNGYSQITPRVKPKGLENLASILEKVGIWNVASLPLSESYDPTALYKIVREAIPDLGI